MPTGLTKDAGWEIGVSRPPDAEVDDVWSLLTSVAGLAVWLGEQERRRAHGQGVVAVLQRALEGDAVR